MGQMTQGSPVKINMESGPQAQMMRTTTGGTQALAIMQPREIRVVEAKALQEAALLGESAFYGWGAGKDRIEGPAWPLSKSLMRVYGNCSLDMEPVQDLADGWVFTARAVDHETGFSISRQFRQSKRWTVYGKFDEARKEDIRFQIGQSKALRNVALSFLPEWLVDKALDTAKGNVKGQIQAAVEKHGMETVVARALERAKAVDVSSERILAAMGRKVAAAITLEDLVIIHGGLKAIERGTDTADEVFPYPPVQAGEPGSGPQASALDAAFGRVAGTAAPQASGKAGGPAAAPTAPAGPGAAPAATGGDPLGVEAGMTAEAEARAKRIAEFRAGVDAAKATGIDPSEPPFDGGEPPTKVEEPATPKPKRAQKSKPAAEPAKQPARARFDANGDPIDE